MKYLTTVLVVVLFAASAAAQEEDLVDVELHGLFGDELLREASYQPVLVTLENKVDRLFDGELEVVASDWSGYSVTHVVQLDLPPHETRRVQMTLWVSQSGSSLRATYRSNRRLGGDQLGVGYRSGLPVVVLANPPRLRASLADVELQQNLPAGSRYIELSPGAVPFDPESGDPILPTETTGWSSIGLLIAAAPMLERLNAAQTRALEGWVRAGGRVLVFPRSPEDRERGLLGQWLGSVEQRDWLPGVDSTGALYATAESRTELVPEQYGASLRIGFGRVYVATYDGMAPGNIPSARTLHLAVQMSQSAVPDGHSQPLQRLGMAESGYADWTGYDGIRGVLDPNESFRPALGLVAILLVIYVFVVGPLNFRYIGRRNRPLLALVTTPIAALCCLALLLSFGFVGKGVTMRYRAVSLMEVYSGESVGVEERHYGVFTTRPITFALPMGERSWIRELPVGRPLRSTVRYGRERPVLEELRGGLWETIFLDEEGLGSIGGPISIEVDELRLARVRNESDYTLTGAVVMGEDGSIYEVGDVPAGGEAAISTVSVGNLGFQRPMFWGADDDRLLELARHMRLTTKVQRRALFGLTQTLGEARLSGDIPVLLARIQAPEAELGGTFKPELDLRFVRVLPSFAHTPLNQYNPPEDLETREQSHQRAVEDAEALILESIGEAER